MDMHKLGISDIPQKHIKKLIEVFQKAYISRMYRMLVLHVTSFTLFLYKFISPFLDPVTRIKIKLFTSSHPKK